MKGTPRIYSVELATELDDGRDGYRGNSGGGRLA